MSPGFKTLLLAALFETFTNTISNLQGNNNWRHFHCCGSLETHYGVTYGGAPIEASIIFLTYLEDTHITGFQVHVLSRHVVP